MEKNNLEKHTEKLYPFVTGIDSVSKFTNSLMALRRTAFIEGVEYTISNVKEKEFIDNR